MADPTFDAAADTPAAAAAVTAGDQIPFVRKPAGVWETITPAELLAALILIRTAQQVVADLGLDAALAGKASTAHTHPFADLTDGREAVEDYVAGLFVAGTHTGITVVYADNGGSPGAISLEVTGSGLSMSDWSDTVVAAGARVYVDDGLLEDNGDGTYYLIIPAPGGAAQRFQFNDGSGGFAGSAWLVAEGTDGDGGQYGVRIRAQADRTLLGFQLAPGQTAGVIRFTDGTADKFLSGFGPKAEWQPPSLANADAVNGSVFHSTTEGDLVYKAGGGGIVRLGQIGVNVGDGTVSVEPAGLIEFPAGCLIDTGGGIARVRFALSQVTVSGTTLTLDGTSDGTVQRTTNGSAVTATLGATAPAGTQLALCQVGAGQVTFAAGSGAVLHNRSGHTKTAGQWATVSLYVDSNSGGSAAVWVLSGDTSA